MKIVDREDRCNHCESETECTYYRAGDEMVPICRDCKARIDRFNAPREKREANHRECAQAYYEASATVMNNLDAIRRQLRTHAEKNADNVANGITNWGMVGDLTSINEKLASILEQMNGGAR